MIRQIYIDYNIPIIPWELTIFQVHFFYDSLIDGLIQIQKQAKESKKKNGKQI